MFCRCNKGYLAALLVSLWLGGCATAPKPAATPETATAPESAAVDGQPVAVERKEVKLPSAYAKARTLMEAGDYAAAIPVLEQYSRKKPKQAGPLVNLAIAHRANGDLDAALKAAEQAIAVNGASAPAYNQLGILKREQGRFAEAEAAYRRALQLDPAYGLAHRNLGVLLDLYMGRPAEALAAFRRYLELSGDAEDPVNRWVVELERRVAAQGGSAG